MANEKFRELSEKATPGEWTLEYLDGYITGHIISPLHTYCGNRAARKDSITGPDSMTHADGEFIVACVNHVRALLAVPAAGVIPAAWKDEALQDRINEAVDRAQESPAAGEPPVEDLLLNSLQTSEAKWVKEGLITPPVEGKQGEANWQKSIAEDWLNEHKRVWSGYDLHTLIRMLDEACTQAKDITEYDRDKLWCDTLFNDNAKEGSPVVFCGPESGKKIFDNLLTAQAQSRASVLEPDVIETIINVLNNDFTNATDNFLRGQMQQQRMPYDHDNNRAQERRAAWQAKTRKAIAAIRALADAPATGKEGGG